MKAMKIYISGELDNGQRCSITRDEDNPTPVATAMREVSSKTAGTISAMLHDIESFADKYDIDFAVKGDDVDWSEQ